MSQRNVILVRMGLALACFAALGSTGCIGMMAQIGWVTGGDLIPAKYDGLDGKKVAVVVMTQGQTYGPGTEATLIGSRVERLLQREIDEIEIIDQDRIQDWMDQNNWNEVDYVEVGKGVEADMVVAVDIDRYTLTDGPTLYKGRTSYSVKVFDMAKKGNKVVFSEEPPMYEFPKQGGRYRDSTSKEKFERQYVTMLSQRIARHFYPYPMTNDYATDAEFLD